jgi:hypothetical protein
MLWSTAPVAEGAVVNEMSQEKAGCKEFAAFAHEKPAMN